MLEASHKLLKYNPDRHELILSPYVTIRVSGEKKMFFSRDDRDQFILLEATNKETLLYLAEVLRRGIEEKDLIELLGKLGVESPEVWIETCRKKGVLE